MLNGLAEEVRVKKIHKWIVSTINECMDSIDELREKEIEIKEPKNQLNRITGELALKKLQQISIYL